MMKLRGMGGHMTMALMHEITFARRQLNLGMIRKEQFQAIEQRIKRRLNERTDVFGGREQSIRKAIR